MASGALAADNEAYLVQDGAGNSASVTQSATLGAGSNKAGTNAEQMTQSGDNNVLTITQDNGSVVGVPGAWSGYFQGAVPVYLPAATQPTTFNFGLDQNGDYNSADIMQTMGLVRQIQQNAPGSTPTATTKNTLNLMQTASVANRALIGSVVQNYTDGTGSNPGNTANLTQSSPAAASHRLLLQSVYQNGSNNFVTTNQGAINQTIVEVAQDGVGNIGSVTQSAGFANFVQALRQVGNTNNGSILMTGSTNGGNSFNSNSPVGSSGWNFAQSSGANASSLVQLGTGNGSTITVSGSTNQYGVRQNGMGNFALGVVISGNSNSVGIHQIVDGNIVTLAPVNGSFNDIGIQQNGNTNVANVNATASQSRLWLKEQGNSNNVTANQSGAWNVINTNITGNSNRLNILQSGNNVAQASASTITVTVTGHNNNNPALSLTTFSGPAAGVATAASIAQGDLFQSGLTNSLSVTVTNSDNNAFAFRQTGNNNAISHAISGGVSNQIAVWQNGNGNSSVTSQVGSFNIIGITQ
jgi:hypothetical protein